MVTSNGRMSSLCCTRVASPISFGGLRHCRDHVRVRERNILASVVQRDAQPEVAPVPERAIVTTTPQGGDSDDSQWKVLVALSAMVAIICSVDRAAISVAILPMSSQFLWDDSTKGLIASSFFIGYTVTNLIGGVLATRYPPKTVLGIGVAIWSLFTIATPAAAASGSLATLLACRVVMGFGEGVTFPCIQNLVASNVPDNSKSRSLALIYSGVQSGTIVSLLAAPLIIRSFEWPAVFEIFGSVGFVWLLAWVPLVRDKKHALEGSQHPSTRDAAPASEDAHAGSDEGASRMTKKFDFREVPWRFVMRNKAFLAVLIAHAGWGFGHSICYAWLPNFYYTEYGLAVRDSAWLSALPWVCTVLVTNIGGSAADAIVNSGRLSRAATRKLMQGVGSFGPAACLLYLAASADHAVPTLSLTGAVAIMCAALSLGGLTCTGFASNHQDLSARYTGILFGITNASSSLSGSFSTFATGRVLDVTHSWAIVFEVVALVYIGSAAVYTAWASADNQFDNAAAQERAAQL